MLLLRVCTPHRSLENLSGEFYLHNKIQWDSQTLEIETFLAIVIEILSFAKVVTNFQTMIDIQ